MLQYCAKVMRAKCANFVLCLHIFSKKIRPKIRASFRKVLSVISLKQRTQIRRIFKTRTKIPYHRNNSDCRMRNIAVQCRLIDLPVASSPVLLERHRTLIAENHVLKSVATFQNVPCEFQLASRMS